MNTNETPTPADRATLHHDPVSHLHWLEFAGKPDDQTRAALKAAGWRWGGFRKAWYTNRTVPIIPPCVEALGVQEAGDVQYAAERADRLEARAQKHDAAATAAYERSNAAVEHIPLGQPILRGHHSERGHRAALKRARRAMDTSVREAAAAKRLHHEAESSRRHQAHVETPEAMTRRAEHLEAEYRKMRRSIDDYEQRMRASGHDHQLDSDEHRAYCQYAENTRRTAEQLRERIQEAGGIASDHLRAQVGDIVRIHGFTGKIARVNPKTYTVNVLPTGWPLKLDHTWLTQIIKRANESSETSTQTSRTGDTHDQQPA